MVQLSWFGLIFTTPHYENEIVIKLPFPQNQPTKGKINVLILKIGGEKTYDLDGLQGKLTEDFDNIEGLSLRLKAG